MTLTALDVAAGFPYGRAVLSRRSRGPLTAASPLEALEMAIVPAVLRGSCCVSFSGGLDSSLVLAVATGLARRLGVPDPVPLTWRFTDASRAEESEWQEAVISELGLADWQRLTVSDELDWVGPVAAEVLREHGLLYPPNAFLHAPLLARAAGGTLLTGVGGDQILGLWRGRRVADLLSGRRRPELRDPLRIGTAVLGDRARRRIGELRDDNGPAWLTAPTARRVRELAAAETYGEPLTWPVRTLWRATRRDTRLTLDSLGRLATAAGAEVACPLLDDGFIAAVAVAGGRWGIGDRRSTVGAWFGAVLPQALGARRTKALFGQVFWRESSAELARSWDGRGVDPALVDAGVLAQLWSAGERVAGSALLLQQVWLAQQLSGGRERVE